MYFDAVVPQVSLKDMPGIARAAEELGYDALWTSETRHDPLLPCALIAEHTRKLRFGTAIAVSFARSPANLAYTAWDLAEQSRGRFILGLGTQVKAHIERRFGMQWPESVTGRLREQILVIRALWDCWQNGRKLNFRSEHYKLTLMSPFFNPGPIEKLGIPIYIAGVNPGLAKLAGEICDGFHVHPFHSRRYLRDVMLPADEEVAKQAGRKRKDIAVTVTAFVATSPKEEDLVRAQIAFYASTPLYRPVMSLNGWDNTAGRLSAHAAHGEWTEMPALISDEMLHEFCLVMAEDNLASALKERYDGIADRLAEFNPLVPGRRDDYWGKLIRNFKA